MIHYHQTKVFVIFIEEVGSTTILTLSMIPSLALLSRDSLTASPMVAPTKITSSIVGNHPVAMS